MGKREEFEKIIKRKGIGLLIAGLFVILSTLVTDAVYYFSKKDYTKDAVALADAKTGDFAYVDVSIMSDYFATNDYTGVDHKTYFVWDEKYIYIVDLNDKNREDLNPVYDYSYSEDENAVAPEAKRIYGMVKSIPSDLKKIAIDSYNEMKGEKVLNLTNFKDYLGTVYMDTFETPNNDIISTLSVSVIFFVIGGLLIIAFVCVKARTKKNMKKVEEKWDTILNELDSSDCFHYKKASLYITKNYLISYAAGLELYDYKDIVWIYPHEYRYNGSLSQKSMMIVLKDSKTKKLATVSASKKNLNMFDEMYESLLNKMPDVLSGYTKENKDKAKQLYQK